MTNPDAAMPRGALARVIARSDNGSAGGLEWLASDGLVDYAAALAFMEARVEAIIDGRAGEAIWLLEHPPLYTAGTSARAEDLLTPGRFPVIPTGRGGQLTYHGPGMRIGYVMLDLRCRGQDLRGFVHGLEEWLIAALWRFNLRAERRPGRVGLWVARGPGAEDKIAALGIRVRRWVSFHGFAINVDPELEHFSGIVPCGIGGMTDGVRTGVTSLTALGYPVTLEDIDNALMASFGGGPI